MCVSVCVCGGGWGPLTFFKRGISLKTKKGKEAWLCPALTLRINALQCVCVCVCVSLGALCLIFPNAAPPAVFVRVHCVLVPVFLHDCMLLFVAVCDVIMLVCAMMDLYAHRWLHYTLLKIKVLALTAP